MRIYYILVLYLFYGGTLLCAQVTKTPKKSTVKTTVANTETLSVWMSRNLNIQPPRKVGKVGIPKKINISQDLTPTVIEALKADMWLGADKFTNAEFQYYPSYVRMDYYFNDLSKILLINNHYLILSYHLSLGSSGDALLIDLNTMKFKELTDYTAYKFKSEHVLLVVQDYYDDQGHFWEYGEYNILTGAYKFISKEH